MAEPKKPGLARSAGIVGIATTASRVLGLVREQTVAFLFGASMATDAFNIAFRVPNLLRDLFAEGALSAAFVPTFTQVLETRGKDEAFVLARRVIGFLLLVVGTICLAGMIFAPQVVRLIAPGAWSVPGEGELAVVMTRIMMPFLLFIALAALTMGMLNSMEYYAIPALAPMMMNLGMIVVGTGLVLAAPRLGMVPIVGLAIGVIVGGLLQFVVQLLPLYKEGFSGRPEFCWNDPGLKRILLLLVPAAVGLAATQVNVVVNTVLASYLPLGSISWLSYAFRLMQLPIGMFGVSVGTVVLPALTRALSRGEQLEGQQTLVKGLRLVLVMTVPAAMSLAILAEPVVSLLYQYRKFSAFDSIQTAHALVAYAVGLTGFAAVKVLVPAFYALNDAWYPVKISMITVALNLILNVALMRPLGHSGLALATSLTGLLNMALLLPALARRLGSLDMGSVWSCLWRVLAACVPMAVVQSGTATGLALLVGTGGFVARVLIVVGASATGGLVLALSLKLLAIDEIDTILALFARKLRRTP